MKAKRHVNVQWLLAYPGVQSLAHCSSYYITTTDQTTCNHQSRFLLTMPYFMALSLVIRFVTFSNLTYTVCRLESWQYHYLVNLTLPNAKLSPSYIRTIHPRENMSSEVWIWNKLVVSHTLGLQFEPSVTSSSGQPTNHSRVLIQCNRWNCPRNAREIALTSLVRPKLEYASAARNRFSKKDISALKRIQHKAAR